MQNRNVILKIRNLLRRAEANSGATLHEQLACAEIAQRLMDTYRISYEAVMSENDISGVAQERIIDYIRDMRAPFMGLKNPPTWIQALANVVAKHNNCRVYLINCHEQKEDGTVDNFVAFSIVGRATDIAVTAELCWWLVSEVYRIGRREGEGKTDEWFSDFRLGAVQKLKEKFQALKNSKKEVPGLSEEQIANALVRIENYRKEVEEFFKDSERWKSQTTSANNAEAFMRGYNAAEHIHVQREKELKKEEKKLNG